MDSDSETRAGVERSLSGCGLWNEIRSEAISQRMRIRAAVRLGETSGASVRCYEWKILPRFLPVLRAGNIPVSSQSESLPYEKILVRHVQTKERRQDANIEKYELGGTHESHVCFEKMTSGWILPVAG